MEVGQKLQLRAISSLMAIYNMNLFGVIINLKSASCLSRLTQVQTRSPQLAEKARLRSANGVVNHNKSKQQRHYVAGRATARRCLRR